MKRLASYFTSPLQITVREEDVPDPRESQVLVKTEYSAISAGTELHFYRGDIPSGIALDSHLPSLAGSMGYPMKYGYATVGQVVSIGSDALRHWLGRRVFAYNPHEAYFVADVIDVLPIPEDVSSEDAVFFANMETAVSLAMDGRPSIGESVAIFGQGVVGLLLSALVGKYPIIELMAFDPIDVRRNLALEFGASITRAPSELSTETDDSFIQKVDLAFELSGNPAALDLAISVVGYGGRVIVGSWYADSKVSLHLGHEFHRKNIRIVTSQVSRITPHWTGRWTKARRRSTAWNALRDVHPRRLITHFCPITDAPNLYRQLNDRAEHIVQVVFTY